MALGYVGGPESWDLHCLRQEREYEALIEGMTCLDCGHCDVCDVKGYEDIGYCKMYGEFVSYATTPRDLECEDFI